MKQLALALLKDDGCYLMHRTDTKGRKRYMLYEPNQSPVRYFSDASIRKYKKLFKKDKRARMTLNLALVRQLHGKAYIKRLYKNLKTTI